ncbi:hypothetical protein GCM10009714_19920 [Microlunatus capsulatus]
MGRVHIGQTIIEGFTAAEMDGLRADLGPRLLAGEAHWLALQPSSSGPVVVWVHPEIDVSMVYDEGEQPSSDI